MQDYISICKLLKLHCKVVIVVFIASMTIHCCYLEQMRGVYALLFLDESMLK